MQKTKSIAIAISICLIISMSASMALLPPADAHTPAWDIPTFAYVVAMPSPVGVNQTTTIYMFLGNPPYPSSAMNNDYRFHNYSLTITAPDGTEINEHWETIQDTTNSQFYSFKPTMVGTYNLSFTYGGQKVNDYSYDPASAYVNDTFLPSSNTAALIVQEEPLSTIPDTPLPTEYWTRPIYGENTGWWSISSNWLGTGILGYGGMPGPNEQMFSGDSIGPQTSHVMWTKPLQSGGVVGGNNFEIQGNAYFEGSAYNQRFINPIVINGKLYYTETVSYTGTTSGQTKCVDLRTGEVIWSKDIPALSFGLVWDHEDPNQHGVYPAILFTSNFAQGYDADTGIPLFNVTGVPSGTSVRGPNGEVLRYVFVNLGTTSSPDWRLAQWNSSKLWSYIANPYTGGSLLSPSIINATSPVDASKQALITTVPIPLTGTTCTLSNGTANVAVPYGSSLVVNGGVFNSSNAQNRYDWNVSASWISTMATSTVGFTATPQNGGNPVSILSVFPGDMLLCRNGSYPALGAYNPYSYFAVNLNASKGTVGSILWSNTIQPPTGKNITTITYAGADRSANVFVESYRQTMQFRGFSLTDGKPIWIGESQGPLDYYGSQGPGTLANQIAYGRIYSSAYDGILYCYDMQTGETLWTYGNGGPGNTTASGFEVPGRYPTFVNAIGNDVVYLVTSEHTVTTPIYKGGLMRAVNATTGTEIWTLSNDNNEFLTSSFAIADGFAVTFNAYDNQIYSIGRGPSQTTVQASPKVSSFGSNVVIEGSVIDIAAGTKQNEQAARFPHGVPASSDASMGDWMGYVYQQKPCPTNFEGVTVDLFVVDANSNFRPIGSATTDASGAYSFVWAPDIPGTYTVIASFAGTNGYWPSSQETAFNIMESSQATAAPTETPQSMADLYFLPVSIAIIVAIVLIGAVLAILIQKRP